MIEEKELVVVHSDEAHSLLYNPATHEVASTETNDGNVMLSIRPKAEDGAPTEGTVALGASE